MVRAKRNENKKAPTKVKMKLKILPTSLLIAFGVLAASTAQAAPKSALMEPVKSVYEHYIKIQTALASDSTKDVAANAAAMAKAIRSDTMKMLSPKVAQQAEALAKAATLESEREAFKPLSQSLIEYLNANPASPSGYVEVFCPMAKAGWLQTSPPVANPYMGKSMLRCGSIKPKTGLQEHSAHDHSHH